MPALLLLSPEPLAGKTTIAVGLAEMLRSQGRSATSARLPGDVNAAADGALFASLGRSSTSASEPSDGVRIIEAPAGDSGPHLPSNPDARALVIADGSKPLPPLVDYCQALGDRFAGLVLNRTPAKRIATIRRDAESAGLNLVAVLAEDRLLAAPILGDVALALSATVEHFNNGTALRPLDRAVIATISADPGQAHFARYDASAVIVRSDKPDLQLAALNAGATCLIVTGGLPLLSYVLDRAEEDDIPLLRTDLDTIATVKGIEEMFAGRPFSGGEAKVKHVTSLLAKVDAASLAG
jgi:BioD-like phosphotransacetylase family protein